MTWRRSSLSTLLPKIWLVALRIWQLERQTKMEVMQSGFTHTSQTT